MCHLEDIAVQDPSLLQGADPEAIPDPGPAPPSKGGVPILVPIAGAAPDLTGAIIEGIVIPFMSLVLEHLLL
jgi:hypothetical protein